jgi:hypothetical protein
MNVREDSKWISCTVRDIDGRGPQFIIALKSKITTWKI